MVASARRNTAAWARRLVHPRAWPVRWRLALVSSGLTLVILLIFGGTIGQIATSRIRDDFNDEVHNAVESLQREVHIFYTSLGEPEVVPRELAPYVATDDAKIRVYDRRGLEVGQHHGAGLGPPPHEVGVVERNGMRIETAVLSGNGYVQYGRSTSHVDATIGRIWLLIALGILGGTLLAALAGVAIASRER